MVHSHIKYWKVFMQRAGKILGHRMQFDGMLIREKVTIEDANLHGHLAGSFRTGPSGQTFGSVCIWYTTRSHSSFLISKHFCLDQNEIWPPSSQFVIIGAVTIFCCQNVLGWWQDKKRVWELPFCCGTTGRLYRRASAEMKSLRHTIQHGTKCWKEIYCHKTSVNFLYLIDAVATLKGTPRQQHNLIATAGVEESETCYDRHPW